MKIDATRLDGKGSALGREEPNPDDIPMIAVWAQEFETRARSRRGTHRI